MVIYTEECGILHVLYFCDRSILLFGWDLRMLHFTMPLSWKHQFRKYNTNNQESSFSFCYCVFDSYYNIAFHSY